MHQLLPPSASGAIRHAEKSTSTGAYWGEEVHITELLMSDSTVRKISWQNDGTLKGQLSN
jgi:hypothetical protein